MGRFLQHCRLEKVLSGHMLLVVVREDKEVAHCQYEGEMG